MLPLPIDEHLPAVIAALQDHSCLVLCAATGAGKTTRVPPALFDAGLVGDRQIVLLQPRRIAARAAAARISQERGTALGEFAGYEVRFDRRTSRNTRILAVTDGVFVRMLADDPLLERVGIVIFDEFHERSLNSDLALAMVRRVQQEVRPDLKLIAMSATLAAGPLAQFLDNCPIIVSQGRLFPVDIQYTEHGSTEPIHAQAAAGVEHVLQYSEGDVLVFLPGVGEIRRTARELETLGREQNIAVMELFGDMPLEQQQAVLAPAERRKIVLATNVAETSITIEGITAVVDTGWARVLRNDSKLGMNRLELERISQAAADQRAGRAGRTAPGICLRLWTKAQHRHFPEFDDPEIRRVDLAGPVLELLAWGEPDPAAMPWYEPPSAEAVAKSLSLLRMLGAVDHAGITSLGRNMARLPVHPRLARLMLEGARWGHASEAATLAALLSERDVFQRSVDTRPSVARRPVRHGSDSDLLDRLSAMETFERNGDREFEVGKINASAARFVLKSRDQLLQALEQATDLKSIEPTASNEEALRRALMVAYLDRLARRREPNSRRARMLGGRGVRLADTSAVTENELFVCVDVDDSDGAEALVRLASAVERDWLPAEQLRDEFETQFDPLRERVVARKRRLIGDLVISESESKLPPEVDPGEILAREAAARLDLNKLLDDDAEQFIARVKCLSQWLPEQELPQWGEDLLANLLPELCFGRSSFAELRTAPIVGFLRSKLTAKQLAALDREAPERLTVPSGSRIALRYEPGQSPVLAVRIQEMFGLPATPRIAAGRVPVLLHLLAPSNRPQQITADLASFWRTTYPQVRNELRRRYPKHAWPDDPLTAKPEHRPQRKR